MKNANKVLFLSLFVITAGVLHTQSKPIIGYGTMEWGTTIEEFKKLYPDAVDITTSEQNAIGEKNIPARKCRGRNIHSFF